MERVKTFKLLVETALLCIGVVYAAAFAWRTWPFPTAAMSLSEQKRTGNQDKSADIVLLQARFALGSRSNFNVAKITTTCEVNNSSANCALQCPRAEALLTQGELSAGDSFTWTCFARDIPEDSCVLITVNVLGTASFPAWGESKWWSTYLSCPDN